MNIFKYTISIILFLFFASSCESTEKGKELPFLGHKDGTKNHMVPDFQFINQDSVAVTKETFEDKIFIVDYFFTSCPTICPKVKQQLLRIEEKFTGNKQLGFLSVSFLSPSAVFASPSAGHFRGLARWKWRCCR